MYVLPSLGVVVVVIVFSQFNPIISNSFLPLHFINVCIMFLRFRTGHHRKQDLFNDEIRAVSERVQFSRDYSCR